MNKVFISFCVVTLALASCLKSASPITLRRGDVRDSDRDGTGTSPGATPVTSGDENEGVGEVPPAVFVSAVECSDTGPQRLVVYRDSVLFLALYLDVPNGIGSDPDTHFLFSDSLFTTTTWRGRTIVALCGRQLFSYEGREYVCGIVPCADGIWLLGNDRSGGGFSLRHNAEPVYKSGTGSARGLCKDSGHIYFVYEAIIGDTPIISIVEDGTPHGLSPRYGTKVLDATISGGRLWQLEESSAGWTVHSGDERFDYEKIQPFQPCLGRLYRRPDGRCAAVISLRAPGSDMPVDMLCEDGKSRLCGGGSGVYHIYDGKVPYHLTYLRDMSSLVIGREEDEIARLDSVVVETARCAAVFEDKLAVVCHPLSEGKAQLWYDGKTRDLGFDGYPTGVSVRPPN